MRWVIKRLICQLVDHDYKWEFPDHSPGALRCRRCGHYIPEGFKWYLSQLNEALDRKLAKRRN